MIELTDKEFEEIIEKALENGKPITKLNEELQTDFRTLMRKISIMSATNPELYRRFIEKHPYKPRKISGISIRNIVIDYLKGDVFSLEEMALKNNMGIRTLTRKINKLRESENEEDRVLYDLYKAVAYNHKHGKHNSIKLIEAIEKVEKDKKFEEIDDIEKKRLELLEIEKKYEELSAQMSREDAAKTMGYSKNRIWKLLNELYRIEIELSFRRQDEKEEKTEQGEKDNFKSGLKVKLKENSQENQTSIEQKRAKDVKTEDIEREER